MKVQYFEQAIEKWVTRPFLSQYTTFFWRWQNNENRANPLYCRRIDPKNPWLWNFKVPIARFEPLIHRFAQKVRRHNSNIFAVCERCKCANHCFCFPFGSFFGKPQTRNFVHFMVPWLMIALFNRWSLYNENFKCSSYGIDPKWAARYSQELRNPKTTKTANTLCWPYSSLYSLETECLVPTAQYSRSSASQVAAPQCKICPPREQKNTFYPVS